MTKKTRTILFVICVILFALAAPAIVFYSEGYRFDFENRKVVQTGAFYFKVSPRSAEVYLNGKFKDKTSIFTNSSLIENLMPKTYNIEIKKEGYYAWQKNLVIKEKQVTEAKNITLITQNPHFTIIATTTLEINNFVAEIKMKATSSDEKKVVEFNNYEIWVSFLEARPVQPQRMSAEKVFLTRFSEKIGNIFWLTDYYLIFNVGDKLKVAEIDDRDRLNIVDLAEFVNPTIFWHEPAKKLYVLSENNLYLSANLLP